MQKTSIAESKIVQIQNESELQESAELTELQEKHGKLKGANYQLWKDNEVLSKKLKDAREGKGRGPLGSPTKSISSPDRIARSGNFDLPNISKKFKKSQQIIF